MPHLRHILSLGLALILLMASAAPLAAQDDQGIDSPDDFEGFVFLADRYYVHDPEALEAAVTAATATPAAFPPVMAIVMVMAFDSAANGEAAFVPFSELMADSVTSELDDASAGEPVADLGDEALAYHAADESDGFRVDVTILTVRKGEVIYLALTMTANDTSDDLSRAFMDVMLSREIGDGDVEFQEDGSSTGGAFDLFPTLEDDDLLGGMEIQSDQYLTASGD
jgi:hypothetical protein